ncbi:hypothetical protein ABPG74_002663 [Tetrahymena malaccensis]
MIKKLIALSLSITLIFAAAGADVICSANTNDVTACGPAASGQWVVSGVKSKIADCSAVNYTNVSGIFDTVCTSCPPTDNIGNIYANQQQSGCTSTAQAGANVNCGQTDCSSCGTAPTGFTWKGTSPNCNIASCLAAPLPSTGITDNFCGSCGKSNKFANSYGSGCVNSSKTCTKRTDAWTDSDCSVCNQGGANSTQAYASKDGKSCVASSASCSRSTNWNDNDCKACSGAQVFASNDAKSCVASSATCSRSTNWNDNDCQACSGAQVFASNDVKSCVASSATCSRNTNWNDADCQACNGGSNYYASADQKSCVTSGIANAGSSVNCGVAGDKCAGCGTAPTGFTWTGTSPNCNIASCFAAPLPSTGITDNFCGSCGKSNKFANSYSSGCVNSSKTCTKRTDAWTDSDCSVCNQGGANSTQAYVSKDGKSCVASSASCSRSTNWNDNDCKACSGAQVFASNDAKSCVASSATCSRSTNWNDNDCQACSGAQVFASNDAKSCVASSATCSRNTNWNDADCQACNGGSNYYASADQKSCVTSGIANAGSSVNCGVAGDKCAGCGTAPTGFTWTGTSPNCNIASCFAAPLPSTGITDNFCGSCGKSNKFANSYGSGCVNSSKTCTKRTDAWTDSDCSVCNQGGANSTQAYASKDGKSCVASSASCSRSTNWNDNDCKACSGAQVFASNDAKSCVASSATCSRSTNWNDSDCKACSGAQVFASIDAKSCVASSATCSRITNLNDADCQACNGGSNYYASADQKSCVTSGIANAGSSVNCGVAGDKCAGCGTAPTGFTWTGTSPNCNIASCFAAPLPSTGITDNFCGSCGKSNKFANSYGSGCVNSSKTCTKRTDAWTDSDCSVCNQGGANSTQAYASKDGKSCVASSASCSRSTNWNDSDCQACSGAQVFASNDAKSCVASSATCSRSNNWNDADCQACNGGSNYYTSADQSSCVTSGIANAGSSVNCGVSGDKCAGCGTAPTGFTWTGTSPNCNIASCLAAPLPSTGITDNFCGSCGKSNKFANSYGSGCVNSSKTCTRSINWFDADCLACNGTGSVYAAADQKSCVNSIAAIGKAVTCGNTGDKCAGCGAAPTGFTWTPATSSCSIASCLAAPQPSTGLTDGFCGSCGNGSKFANSYGLGCVNSSASCTRNNSWNDADCQVCNANGSNSANLFAAADQKSCTAKKPSNSQNQPSSTASSVIIFSSIILVISLLI